MSDMVSSTTSKSDQEIWNENAPFWDERHGDDGNEFHRLIVEPTALSLLKARANERILEIACGNGAFARRLASLGANVLATDFSSVFLEKAKTRTRDDRDKIEYRLLDATNEAGFRELGGNIFDAAVCNMGIMDIAEVDPLFRGLRHALKPNGRFVFTLQHPAFNSNDAKKVVELDQREGKIEKQYSIKVSRYLTPSREAGIGIIGQTWTHTYYNRPISLLLQHCFDAGFVVDGFIEAIDPREHESAECFSWLNFKETPPVLGIRARLSESVTSVRS
jgi:SAM-dependent methyltransferase